MAGKPAEPPPSSRSQIHRSEEGSEQQQRDERAAALTIARHVNEDGRALILYSHDQREHA
jgi:hypothetical protein